MENDQQGNLEKENRESVTEKQVGVSSGFNRRKFLKTAIVTAPVILTVTSRPVFAGSCSESGQLSGNLSNAEECENEGCTPGIWKQAHKDNWHYKYHRDKSFLEIFGRSPFVGSPDLFDVVGGDATPNIEDIPSNNNLINMTIRLCSHTVAALENAATDVKYHYTVADVIYKFSLVDFDDARSMEILKDDFVDYNELGCFLS